MTMQHSFSLFVLGLLFIHQGTVVRPVVAQSFNGTYTIVHGSISNVPYKDPSNIVIASYYNFAPLVRIATVNGASIPLSLIADYVPNQPSFTRVVFHYNDTTTNSSGTTVTVRERLPPYALGGNIGTDYFPAVPYLSTPGPKHIRVRGYVNTTSRVFAMMDLQFVLEFFDDPTNDKTTSKCFETREELDYAIKVYIQRSSPALLQNIQTTYGVTMNDWCVSKITSFNELFSNYETFNEDLDRWNTSAVTSMTYTFFLAREFNGRIDTWDTSNVMDMTGMFQYAHRFNRNIDPWDVSKVTSMEQMFLAARDYNQDMDKWDTKNVKTMQQMFAQASNFDGTIGSWDTSSVTNILQMFGETNNFNQNIGRWNTSSVTNMDNVFFVSQSFNQDISGWDVSKVTTMDQMFNWAGSFRQNLCPWGNKLSPSVHATWTFLQTDCFSQDSPNFTATPPGPFCYAC